MYESFAMKKEKLAIHCFIDLRHYLYKNQPIEFVFSYRKSNKFKKTLLLYYCQCIKRNFGILRLSF